MLLDNKFARYISLAGFLLSAFALLASTLLGFGGFSVRAISSYIITGYVSRFQMVFLILTGVGLTLSGVVYADQAKKQEIKNPSILFLLCFAVSIVFFAMGVFGLTSKLNRVDFWGETTFEEVKNAIFFNNLTLTGFLFLGTLQVILSIIFLKTKILQHQLSKTAKVLTLTSGLFLLIKAIIDYPLVKEGVFIVSYMIKFPFPNNILSLAAPLAYLSAQIPITIILARAHQNSQEIQ